MKKLSVRKIVLYSISLIASIMLLIGLTFKVVGYDMNLGKAVSKALDQVGACATGFDMLSFGFPETFKALILVFLNDEFLGSFEVIFAVLSLITLIFSLLSIFLVVFSFFKHAEKKGEKLLIKLAIFSVIISAAYAILSIVFTSMVQKEFTAVSTSGTVVGKYVTNMFVSLIFQVVFLIVLVICDKSIKVKDESLLPVVKEGKQATQIVKYEKKLAQEKIDSILEAEKLLIDLLKEYKSLYDESIITSADYMDKKVKLMKTAEAKLGQETAGFVNNATFQEVIKAEMDMTKLLREYKELLEVNIISDADYTERKVGLLNCIIK